MGAEVTGLTTDAVFVIDANTRELLQANRAFSRVFGYAAEEVPTLSLFDIAVIEKVDVQANLAKLDREGEIDLGVRPFRSKDGASLEMEVRAGQMVVDGRRLFCVIARDLSERRCTERALMCRRAARRTGGVDERPRDRVRRRGRAPGP